MRSCPVSSTNNFENKKPPEKDGFLIVPDGRCDNRSSGGARWRIVISFSPWTSDPPAIEGSPGFASETRRPQSVSQDSTRQAVGRNPNATRCTSLPCRKGHPQALPTKRPRSGCPEPRAHSSPAVRAAAHAPGTLTARPQR